MARARRPRRSIARSSAIVAVRRSAILYAASAVLAVVGCAGRALPTAAPREPLGAGESLRAAGTAIAAGRGASEALPRERSSAARGRTIYVDRCTPCHGTAGAGDGPLAPALRPPPTDFTDAAYMREQRPSWYYRAVSRGVVGTAMGRWDHQLDERDRWDVAFYAWSAAVTPKRWALAADAYASACARCHGPDGRDSRAPLDGARLAALSRRDLEEITLAAHATVDLPPAADVAAAVELVFTFLYEPYVPEGGATSVR